MKPTDVVMFVLEMYSRILKFLIVYRPLLTDDNARQKPSLEKHKKDQRSNRCA
jgi:hypothetical protein